MNTFITNYFLLFFTLFASHNKQRLTEWTLHVFSSIKEIRQLNSIFSYAIIKCQFFMKKNYKYMIFCDWQKISESKCFSGAISQPHVIKLNHIFLGVVSFGRVVEPSPIIVMNLLRNYEKQHCKKEQYRFSGQKK